MSNLPFFKEFITYLRENNYSEETAYNYKRDLEAFENFLNKVDIKFREVTKQVIVDYKRYLASLERKTVKNQKSNQLLSSFSINRMLSSFKSYLKYLINVGEEIPLFPESIELIRSKRQPPLNIKIKDQIKLIEAPTKFEKNKVVALRNRAMLKTIFSTGVRISELLNFKKDQIDKAGRIFIRGKGKKERFVYLTPRAEKHLKNYLEARGITESPFLFIPYQGKNAHKKNKKISPNYLQERIKNTESYLG